MIESTTLISRRLADTSPDAVRDAVEGVIEPAVDGIGRDSVVVVPDVHYPYHPSTGLVSHPAVVSGIATALSMHVEGDVVVGCRSGPQVSTETTLSLLGYRRLDVELVDLDDVEMVTRRASVPNGAQEVAVPRPLVDATVVVVPTLRTDPDTGLALGMATLARAVRPDGATAEEIWAVGSLCSPRMTVVDASYSYLGRPRSTGFLLAGDDVVAVDSAVAGATDRSPTYLDGRAVRELNASHAVEGLALETDVDLSTEPTPSVGQPGGLMRTAYRLYAGLAGDCVPPQFLR